MQLWLVTIGNRSGSDGTSAAATLRATGANVEATVLSGDPGRTELDAALDAADGRRLVVHASTADLARFLRRMMRRDELATLETAVLPTEPVPFLARFGVTPDLASAARIATAGQCRTVGLLKDDSGNLVVDSAELRPWTGRRVWVRAYVDDEPLCDGEISSLRVERGDAGGLRATARTSRWRPPRTIEGRGLTLAADDAAISSDGADREQPRRKRIWWDEPGQWRLAAAPPSVLA